MRCARCLESWYCNTTCQKQHWKAGHRTKCANAVKADKAKALHAEAAASAATTAAQCGGGASAAADGKSRKVADYFTRAAPPTAAAAEQRNGGANAATSGDEECAICLDTLQQPQTLRCGHRFCRGCVRGMRQHGVGESQVCPICRAPMPDAERLSLEALHKLMQYERWPKGKRAGGPQPPWVPRLLNGAAAQLREALVIDPEHAGAHTNLGYALLKLGNRDGALSAYRAAVAADPQCAKAHFNLGCTLASRGDYAAAAASFAKVVTATATAAAVAWWAAR